MKRTKIVCTVGPASMSPSMLNGMIRAGMNMARLNLSHGTHETHWQALRAIRIASRKAKEPIAVLGDLQGPKIRLGVLPEKGVALVTGKEAVFSTAAKTYANGVIPVTFANLHKDVKKGHRMLIDDGLLEVKIVSVKGKVIKTKVINGGTVTSHKGMNFPDTTLRVPALTAKDRADVKFAVQAGVDFVALSFVTRPEDVRTLRRLIKAAAHRSATLPRIIVKIEKHEAIKRFAEILAEADGVMIARGDLGVEIPAEQVPVEQKRIISLCRRAGKPVIVATQMLDSMIRNPRPTRAEVSDVANAVFDHTDAVMLSGETATGKYPLAAVRMMASIINEAEASPFDDVPAPVGEPARREEAIARAVKLLADAGDIVAVAAHADVTPWAETLLSERPEIPFVFACAAATEMRQAAVRWGVRPILMAATPASTLSRRLLATAKKLTDLKPHARVALILGREHGSGFDVVS